MKEFMRVNANATDDFDEARKVERTGKLLILAFVAFVCPLGARILSIDIGIARLSVYRIALIIALIALIYLSTVGHGVFAWKKENAVIVFFLSVWLVYAVITGFWAIDISNWVRNVYFLAGGVFLTIYCLNSIRSLKSFTQILLCFNMGIAVQAGIGIYEILTKDYHFIDMEGVNYSYYVLSEARIPIAMLGNPNDFATLMYIGIIISAVCVVLTKQKLVRFFNAGLAIVFSILLVLTKSRACLVGLIVTIAFFLLFIGYKGWGILTVIIAASLCTTKVERFVSRFLEFDFVSGNNSEGIRVNLIKNGFLFLEKTFGFGVGAGQVESWMKTKAVFATRNITSMHNWWMEILTSYGIIIFIGYLLVYSLTFYCFAKAMHRTARKEIRNTCAFICASLVGYVIVSVSASSNLTSEYIWLSWALIITLQGIIMKEEGVKCPVLFS